MYIPVNPSFTIQKWGVKGSLYRHVFVVTTEGVGPRGHKTFSLLNLAEHDLFCATKYENVKKKLAFSYLLAEKFHA